MTAPGTILLSKMLVPETESPLTSGKVQWPRLERDKTLSLHSSWHHRRPNASRSTSPPCLITFIAMIYLVDGIFGAVQIYWRGITPIGFHQPGTSSRVDLFPIAWIIGIPWQDCRIGDLLGLRMVTNELIAFQRLGPMKREFTLSIRALSPSPPSRLCGFANFSSIGIQIGGIGALAPNKRSELPSSASAPCSAALWPT